MPNLFEIGLINAALATVLAAIVWIVTRAARNPVLVHALWVIVLLKLVTPPFVSFSWSYTQPPAHTPASVDPTTVMAATPLEFPAVSTDANLFLPGDISDAASSSKTVGSPTTEVDQFAAARDPFGGQAIAAQPSGAWPTTFPGTIATLWLAGSAIWLIISVARMARFHRALADTAPAPQELRDLAHQVATRLGVTRRFRLRITEGRLSPLVWPIGRPTILLSRPLVTELSPEETQALLAHEFAHLRRMDHWVRWLEMAATVLYWWHPVVWLSRAIIRKTEEQACDAWVVWAFPDAAKRYASALFTAMQFVSESPSTAPLVASRLDVGGNFKERIEHIMSGNLSCRLSLPVRVTVLLLALVILPLSLRAVRAADEKISTESASNDATLHTELTLPIELEPSTGPDLAIERSLDTPVAVHFVETPLAEAMLKLSDTVGVDIYLDPRGLDQEGVTTDVPVTAQLKNEISLKSALNLLLEPLHLTIVIEDEVIKVTSEQGRRVPVAAKPYDIAPGDLLKVTAAGVHPDEPIGDMFVVEPGGTIALGPTYGRVKVAGLSLEQAEQTTRDLLAKDFKNSKVQITLGGWQQGGPSEPRGAFHQNVGEHHELAQWASVTPSSPSIGVLNKIVASKKRNIERVESLAQKSLVSSAELEQAVNDYEISVEQFRQAERALEYNKLLVELAETEYQQALKANKSAPNTITELEVRKLKIKVELAKAKLRELAE